MLSCLIKNALFASFRIFLWKFRIIVPWIYFSLNKSTAKRNSQHCCKIHNVWQVAKAWKKVGEKGQVTLGPPDKVKRSERSNELFSFISLASWKCRSILSSHVCLATLHSPAQTVVRCIVREASCRGSKCRHLDDQALFSLDTASCEVGVSCLITLKCFLFTPSPKGWLLTAVSIILKKSPSYSKISSGLSINSKNFFLILKWCGCRLKRLLECELFTFQQ